MLIAVTGCLARDDAPREMSGHGDGLGPSLLRSTRRATSWLVNADVWIIRPVESFTNSACS